MQLIRTLFPSITFCASISPDPINVTEVAVFVTKGNLSNALR
jgi:hypothetical protein